MSLFVLKFSLICPSLSEMWKLALKYGVVVQHCVILRDASFQAIDWIQAFMKCDAIKQNESEVENIGFLFFGIFHKVII